MMPVVCSAPVKDTQRGVQCEVCYFWLHAKCIGLTDDEYRALQLSDDPWCCKNCQEDALPFYNVSDTDSVFHPHLNWCSPATFHQSPFDSSQPLSVLYTNCRSILSKIDYLHLLVPIYTHHIIAVCETWLDDNISNDKLYIPGFSLLRRDRHRHVGGIAFFIHDCIPFIAHANHSTLELSSVEFKFQTLNLLCCLFYHPPSSDISILTDLESFLEQLPVSRQHSLLLLGDFNVNLLQSEVNDNHHLLRTIEDKFSLKQIVTTPTRPASASLIDHIYLSENLAIKPCSTLPPLEGSDHSVLLFSLQVVSRSRNCPKRKIWLYHKANFDQVNSTLDNQLCMLSDSEDVNVFWSHWYDTFMATMNNFIPSKLIKPSNNLPYLTKDLISLVCKKHRLFASAKHLCTEKAWSNFTRVRNQVTSALRDQVLIL